jgi:hypothetical protein
MLRIPSLQELAEHARAVAVAFNVDMIEDPRMSPQDGVSGRLRYIDKADHHRAHPELEQRRAAVSPIVDEPTYAVAMHEIGHMADPLGAMDEDRERATPESVVRIILLQERAAWDWARHYALDWTPAMEQVAQLAYGSYLQAAARRADHRVREINSLEPINVTRESTASQPRRGADGLPGAASQAAANSRTLCRSAASAGRLVLCLAHGRADAHVFLREISA